MDRVDVDDHTRLVRRVHAVLRAELTACGYGAIAALERYLGVPYGSIRKSRNNRKRPWLRADKLAAILEVMGIEPVAFFYRVFPCGPPPCPPLRPTTREETLACLNEALRAAFEARGIGAVRATERALGLCEGYIRNNRYTGRLELGMLGAYLQVLRGEPGRFFRRAFERRAVEMRASEIETQPLAGAADPVLAFGAAAGMLPRLPTAHLLSTAPTSTCDPLTPAEEAELARLDALRSDDPAAAREQSEKLCHTALGQGRPRLAVRAAGAAGSARRLAIDLDGAQVLLWEAYRLAERCALQHAAADLIQRMAYVMADRGGYEDALAFVDHAFVRYQDLQDEIGMGRTQVDRGIFFRRMGSSRKALRAFSDALGYLPASEARNRATALHASARLFLDRDDTEQAAKCVEEAKRCFPEENHWAGRFSWLMAHVALARKDFAAADRHYREAVSVLEKVALGDAAIASVELVRLQLEVGNYSEAAATARLMRKSAFSLPENDVVAAVAFKLLRLERMGALSLEAVDELLREAKRRRPQPTPRAAQR